MISRPDDTLNAVIRTPQHTTESSVEVPRVARECPFAGLDVEMNRTQLLNTAKIVLNSLNQVDVDLTV